MIRRNTLLAGVSYGLKFWTNAILLIALARVFGPERFGVFSFSMTAAVFLGAIVDYGFNLQVVKEIPQSPESAKDVLQKVLAGKTLLMLLTFVGCLVFFLFSDLETAILVLVLTLSVILFSFGQFFFSILRAFNRFAEETRSTIISNILLAISLVFLLLFNANIFLISLAFLFSRLLFFLFGARACFNDYGFFINRSVKFRDILAVLKRGFPYAMLIASSLLFLSVDTFIINAVLGSEAVGIYQSGVRFVFAALILSETLMSVYLPVLSGAIVKDVDVFEKRAKQLIRVSIVISLPVGLVLILLPEEVTALILGDAYSRTAELLPYFGLILMLRFLTISYGTLLTAMGLQKKRAIALSLSLAILAMGAYALILSRGLIGVVIASLVAHVALLGFYGWEIYYFGKRLFLEQRTVYMLVLSMTVFLVSFLLKPGLPLALAIISAVTVLSLLTGLSRMEQRSLLRTDWFTGKKQTILKNEN